MKLVYSPLPVLSLTLQEAAEQMQKVAVMAAVDRLNAQLVTLPELIPCLIEGIYPEFGYPDCGPEKYLALLEDEAR